MARPAGDCVPCWQRRQNAGKPKRTMMRVETEFFEYVDTTNRRHRCDTVEEAKAMRAAAGKGQVRRRVDFEDVVAMYEVRTVDGDVVGAAEKATAANEIAAQYPDSKVFMVPDLTPVAEAS